MDYEAYKAEERRLVAAVKAKEVDEDGLWLEVERLRGLIGTVQPAADRERAEQSMASLEYALDYTVPPMTDEMAAAIRVQSRAMGSSGTPEERIEILQDAIAEIGRIARTVTGVEATRIRHLNEPLSMDLEGIRIHHHEQRDAPGSPG